MVLENLGWQLHRVWSTDFWQDPKREVQKILNVLEVAQRSANEGLAQTAPRADAVARAPANAETPPPATRSRPAPPPKAAKRDDRAYRAYQGTERYGSSDEFYDVKAAARIRDVLTTVVEIEGPISLALAARRVTQHWDVQRISKRASERVLKLVDRARVQVTRAGGSFLWPVSLDPATYENFREPSDDPLSRRDADDIPLEEVANAALHVLTSSISLPEDDLIREAARTLGFQRTGRQVQQRMAAGIDRLVERRRAERRGGQIVLCG